jgi:hypothetical protein
VVTASSKYKAAVGNAEVGILFGTNVRSEEKQLRERFSVGQAPGMFIVCERNEREERE